MRVRVGLLSVSLLDEVDALRYRSTVLWMLIIDFLALSSLFLYLFADTEIFLMSSVSLSFTLRYFSTNLTSSLQYSSMHCADVWQLASMPCLSCAFFSDIWQLTFMPKFSLVLTFDVWQLASIPHLFSVLSFNAWQLTSSSWLSDVAIETESEHKRFDGLVKVERFHMTSINPWIYISKDVFNIKVHFTY